MADSGVLLFEISIDPCWLWKQTREKQSRTLSDAIQDDLGFSSVVEVMRVVELGMIIDRTQRVCLHRHVSKMRFV